LSATPTAGGRRRHFQRHSAIECGIRRAQAAGQALVFCRRCR
jgi:hypothetical protein